MRALAVASLAALGCGPAPGTVDVTHYPAEQQANYAVFEDRCSRCHGLDRATRRAIKPGGWPAFVRRMARHPGAGISAHDQRRIAAFLEYHSARRTEVIP